MMHLASRAATALLLLTAVAPAQQPGGDLAEYLPAETFAYAFIQDFGDLVQIDEDGDMMRLLRHDAVKQAFEEVYESFDWLKDKDLMLALNLEPKDLLQMFGGRVAFAVPELTMIESDVDVSGGAGIETKLELDTGKGFTILADFDGTRDQLEELLANIVKVWEEEEDVNKVNLLQEDFEGARIYQVEIERPDGEIDDEEALLGFRDGLLVACNKRDTLEDLLDRVANGSPEGERLTDAPRYLETLDTVGEHDVLIYLNLGEVGPLLNQLIRYYLDRAGDDLEMFVNPDALIECLGLDAFWSMFVGLRMEDDEAELTFGMTHEDRDLGLARLISYADGGVEMPTFFHKDLHSASVTTFDATDAIGAFFDMLKRVSPFGYTWVDAQLTTLEGTFPIRDALLNNMDGLIIDVMGYPEGSTAGPEDHPTQAYIVRVKDAQTLSEGMTELGEMMADDDPIEFMNELIYDVPLSIPMPIPEPRLAFAVVENYLIVSMGEPKMVESIIAHIKNPGESVLDDDLLMDAFDALPSDDIVGLGFADVSDLLLDALRGAGDSLPIMLEPANARRAKKAIEELPDVSDLDYFLVAKTYRTPETAVQRLLIRRGR